MTRGGAGNIEGFIGNATARQTLERMAEQDRIPQTILLQGPGGVGKATLARRFAAMIMGHGDLIETDDLSLPRNRELLAEREKLSADKRSEDPFLLATYPDFVTFGPDGPLRQISIQQMRLLKERAQFGPLSGKWRVFLIDGLDRANEQAANSLLKTLEEPPPYLILLVTAENAYELLPTIRSRVVSIKLGRLSEAEMQEYAALRGLAQAQRRVALAAGSPGFAAAIDLEEYDRRCEAMLALLESAAGAAPFGAWARYSEKIAASRSEKLDAYLDVLYWLLEDLLHLQNGSRGIRNTALQGQLAALAQRIGYAWVRAAVAKTDELSRLLRRNIQKSIALDALVAELRAMAS
jgi:DNA polymerase-3 subunit delta'